MKYHFLIQKNSPLSVESLQLIEVIKEFQTREHQMLGYSHSSSVIYTEIDIGDLCFQKPGYIPVGSIEFVARYLLLAYNIMEMVPIEIPDELTHSEYLLRDYKVVPYENIPRTGQYFFKDVSTLKSFTFSGDMSTLFNSDYTSELRKKFCPNHIYQISSILNILSEYRVIVIDNKIEAIQYYNGEPTIMPNEKEISKIKEMVAVYSISNNKPQAYTMDVAVVRKDNGERDLALIEIHPAVSIGTYGYACQKLIEMYAKGFEWYITNNKPQKYMIKAKRMNKDEK